MSHYFKNNKILDAISINKIFISFVVLSFFSSTVALGQVIKVRTTITPDRNNNPIVEERGMIQLTANGKDYEKRYLIRYPKSVSQWNQRLLIGAHGGSGGLLYDRDGRVIETSETSLDDVISGYAVEQGYAYASVDRDGIGGTREGLALTYAFTESAQNRISKVYGKKAAYVYLTGLSAGGAITRYAAEDTDPKYDGVLIIVGGGGGTTPQLERQARLAALWPEVDPVKYPDLPLTNAKVKAYAKEIGTPVEARPFWPFIGARQTLANFRKTLERFGLTNLTDAQLRNFRMAEHRGNKTFTANVEKAQAGGTTGQLTIPTIEVAATHDDIVIAGILEYKDKVRTVSKNADRPTPMEKHRLYKVWGAWHVSTDDDALGTFQYFMSQVGIGDEVQDWLNTAGTYIPTLEEALGYLDNWVTKQQIPPEDQMVKQGEVLR